MKKLLALAMMPFSAALANPMSSVAQEKFQASAGIELTNSYVWRGQDLGNASIQPSLSLSWKGLSLSAWGSAGFSRNDTREVDLTIGYAFHGFNISVTDYWFDGGAGYFHYGDGNTMHTFEAHAGYDFGFLAIDWYTNFAGNTGYRQNGAKAYASYFSISAPFDFAGLGWKVTAGATPWQNDFYNGGSNSAHAIQAVNGFAVCEVSIRALKNFCILKEWQTSAYVQLTWNPTTEAAHLIAGICL